MAAEDSQLVGYILITVSLIFTLISIQAQHRRRFARACATDGGLSLITGIAAGGLVVLSYHRRDHHPDGNHVAQDLLKFDSDFFFNALLPPIMFNAGFAIKNKLFFKNFFTITLLGIGGTLVSLAAVSMGCACAIHIFRAMHFSGGSVRDILALGAVFAPTDSVAALQLLSSDSDPVLHSLVFGEGVVNDAAAIVLLRAIMQHGPDTLGEASRFGADLLALAAQIGYLFAASMALGVATGLASAVLTKNVFRKQASSSIEVLLVASLAYLGWLVAEALNLSGIFSIFFCGLTVSHYTYHNLSSPGQAIMLHMFRVLATGSELVLFMYTGIDMWSAALWHDGRYSASWLLSRVLGLAVTLLACVMVSRMLFILVLTACVNCWRSMKISFREALILWWAGVSRGAITIALVYATFMSSVKRESHAHFIISTAAMLVVVVTTVGFGAVNQLVLDGIMTIGRPPVASADEDVLQQLLLRRNSAVEPQEARDRSWFHGGWQRMDRVYLQPIFGGRHTTQRTPSISVRRAASGPILSSTVAGR